MSALDLSTQERVLDLFVEIQQQTGVAYLFVSHDLSVVRHISHRVAVMYRGEMVEDGDAATVTTAPAHPYTQRLLLAAPVPAPAPPGGAASAAPPLPRRAGGARRLSSAAPPLHTHHDDGHRPAVATQHAPTQRRGRP